jgi:phosphoribosylanthranilate isomerase
MSAATVKICGLRTVETVQAIRDLPIDHIGFVFAESKRQVTPAQAKVLIDALRSGGSNDRPAPLAVGVFLDPTLEELQEVLAEAPLDAVQVHGSKGPEYIREIKRRWGVKVIKVLSVGPSADGADNRSTEAIGTDDLPSLEAYRGLIDAVLLDTYDPAVGGGTGRTFAWDRIPAYRQKARECGVPLIIAGGLHADNVRDLFDKYAPDGVDVSSGVETDGIKDIRKIATFVERVKSS